MGEERTLKNYFNTPIEKKDIKLNIILYDIEIVKDYLLVGFMPFYGAIYQYRVYNRENKYKRNDIDKIRNFVNYTNSINGYLTAYNNDFDKPILAYILSNEHYDNPEICIDNCKFIADEIINQRGNVDISKYKYTRLFKSFDMAKTCNLNKPFLKSLKLAAASDKFYNIEEFGFNPDENINPDSIPKMEKYNANDLEKSQSILSRHDNITGLLSRAKIDMTYGTFTLGEDNSGMANRIFPKLYAQKANVKVKELLDMYTVNQLLYPKDIMVDKLTNFVNPRLIKMKNDLDKMTIMGYGKLKLDYESFIIKGTEYQIGAGGLHSVDEKAIYKEEKDYYLVDIDVNSFYPYIIYLYRFFPNHLGDVFLKIFFEIIQDRIRFKMSKMDDLAFIYKIILNSTFGKMNASFPNWLKDSKAALGTTLNGQMSLLYLVDLLINKPIDIVSANTDGLTCRFHKDHVTDFIKITQYWMNKTGFTLEYKRYKEIYRDSVNSYIVKYFDIPENENNAGLLVQKSILDNDNSFKLKIKRKGKTLNQYLHEENLYKTLDKPIIAKAIENYFLNGIKPEDTIYKEEDMFLFTSCRKIDKQFSVESKSIVLIDDEEDDDIIDKDNQLFKNQILIKEKESNIIRFYVSKRSDSLVVHKIKKINKKKDINNREAYATETKISLLAGKRISICNNMIVSNTKALTKTGELFYQIDYEYYIKEAYKLINNIIKNDKFKYKKEIIDDQLTLF